MSTNRASAPHVGLSVPDLDQAISWYTDVLGFRLLAGPLEISEDGTALGDVGMEIYGAGYQRWRFAHLATDDNFGLELFQFDSPKTVARENNFEYWFGGFNHLGLTVPDLDQKLSAIVAAGGKARTPVFVVNPEQNHRIVYAEDPWGSVLELCSHSYVAMWGSAQSAARSGAV
ncbi:VOC family protein [Microbacterium sp. NPDC078814]|uniref:VOC family protein n=1 Tax=Microbacterium sp. NPDC078814 TaxID=3154767 RepID=UPI0026A17A70